MAVWKYLRLDNGVRKRNHRNIFHVFRIVECGCTIKLEQSFHHGIF
jgi:hypothetical protein